MRVTNETDTHGEAEGGHMASERQRDESQVLASKIPSLSEACLPTRSPVISFNVPCLNKLPIQRIPIPPRSFPNKRPGTE